MTEETKWAIIHAARRAGILNHCDLTLITRYDKMERIEFYCLGCQGIWKPGLDVFYDLKHRLENNGT